MVVKEFEGKNLEELIDTSLQSLNLTKDDVIITKEEIKGNLLKKTSYKIKVYTLVDIQNYVKEYLLELTKLMGLEVTFESKIRGTQICVKMYSDNNSILIALIILTTYLSFKFSMSNAGSGEQQQQMQFMTTFMLIFISIASFSLPTAIALYWIVTNGFSVLQTLLLKKKRR